MGGRKHLRDARQLEASGARLERVALVCAAGTAQHDAVLVEALVDVHLDGDGAGDEGDDGGVHPLLPLVEIVREALEAERHDLLQRPRGGA